MRQITIEEAEARLRSLIGALRDGASFEIVEQRRPLARLVPPTPADDIRKLAFLALRRNLMRAEAHATSRKWTRADLYRRDSGPA